MTECGIPLLGHFEKVVNDDGTEIDPKDREGRMVDDFLWGFRDKYPLLKKSFEHASTAKAVDWTVADDSGKSFMTVTPQHSLFIATDLEVLGVDLDCMPCEKTAYDRAVIRRFMTSGDARVGAGTDEAPHIRSAKLAGAKGCWTPNAAEMYADVFDAYDALDERFEAFMSINAPVWWGLPLPDADDTVTFVREQTAPPEPIEVPELHDIIVPLGWSEKGPLFTTKFKTL
jgi:dihydroorotase